MASAPCLWDPVGVPLGASPSLVLLIGVFPATTTLLTELRLKDYPVLYSKVKQLLLEVLYFVLLPFAPSVAVRAAPPTSHLV